MSIIGGYAPLVSIEVIEKFQVNLTPLLSFQIAMRARPKFNVTIVDKMQFEVRMKVG